MRYPYGFVVQIPYLETNVDGTVNRSVALVSTNSSVDRRRVRRVLRQWVRKWLGRSVHPVELNALMKIVKKHNEPMMYFVQQNTVRLDETTNDEGSADSEVGATTEAE